MEVGEGGLLEAAKSFSRHGNGSRRGPRPKPRLPFQRTNSVNHRL
jgi:hypothetical protein